MPQAITLLGVNLNDGTNWTGARVVDFGDAEVLEQVFVQNSMSDGSDLARQHFLNRRVIIEVNVPPALSSATMMANVRTLNRLLVSPFKDAELQYGLTASSASSYLDLLPSPPLRFTAPRQVEITVNCRPFWRTISRSSPRILQNLLKNSSVERWAAGAPESWVASGVPTTTLYSAWAKYGRYSLEISKVGADAFYYQNVACETGTIYAVYVWVKPLSGTARLRMTDGAGGNIISVDSSGTSVQKLSYLYTTGGAQTTLSVQLYVISNGDVVFDAVYCALASNTANAIPGEWINYTEDLYNRSDVGTAIVNGPEIGDLLGDAPALAKLRFTASTLGAAADRIHVGIRWQDSEYFTAINQAETGTQNATWAVIENHATASPTAGNNCVKVTSAGTQAWLWACRTTVAQIVTTAWARFKGRYRVFARVHTDAATASNWQLRAAVVAGGSTSVYGEGVSLALTSSQWHLVDLGEFTIPPWSIDETVAIDPLSIELQASVTNESTKVLRIDYLFLCPQETMAQTILAVGAATWVQGYRVYTSTLDLESQAWVDGQDAGAWEFMAAAIPQGYPLYLPVGAYRGGGQAILALRWQEVRDNGQHIVTDRCAIQLSYVPQYLMLVEG